MKKTRSLKSLFHPLCSVLLMLAALALGDACGSREAFCARTGAGEWKGIFIGGMPAWELSADNLFDCFGIRSLPPFSVHMPLKQAKALSETLGLRMSLAIRAQGCRSLNPAPRDLGAFEAERSDPYKSLNAVVPLLTIRGNLDSCFSKFRLLMQRIGGDDR